MTAEAEAYTERLDHESSLPMQAVGSPLEVPADLVRLSVGIEIGDELVEDLRAALG